MLAKSRRGSTFLSGILTGSLRPSKSRPLPVLNLNVNRKSTHIGSYNKLSAVVYSRQRGDLSLSPRWPSLSATDQCLQSCSLSIAQSGSEAWVLILKRPRNVDSPPRVRFIFMQLHIGSGSGKSSLCRRGDARQPAAATSTCSRRTYPTNPTNPKCTYWA